jgi:hypothetical protein
MRDHYILILYGQFHAIGGDDTFREFRYYFQESGLNWRLSQVL